MVTPALAMHTNSDAPVGLVLPGLLFVLYMTPTLIAAKRSRPGLRRLALVNLLLGWTIVGWIVALVWSLDGADAGGEANL